MRNGHKLSVQPASLQVASTEKAKSVIKKTVHMEKTTIQENIEHATWREEDAQLDDSTSLVKDVAQQADSDGAPHRDDKLRDTIGNILDIVYGAVMTRQPLDELEEEGWHADEVHAAVISCCALVAFERRQEYGRNIAAEMALYPE